ETKQDAVMRRTQQHGLIAQAHPVCDSSENEVDDGARFLGRVVRTHQLRLPTASALTGQDQRTCLPLGTYDVGHVEDRLSRAIISLQSQDSRRWISVDHVMQMCRVTA